MAVTVRVEFNNIAAFGRAAQDEIDGAVGDVASNIAATAQSIVPVDTGRLRASISPRRIPGGWEVATDVEYGPFVEFGTGVFATMGGGRTTPWVYFSERYGFVTTSGNPAQPFMRPAYERHRTELTPAIVAGVNAAARRHSR